MPRLPINALMIFMLMATPAAANAPPPLPTPPPPGPESAVIRGVGVERTYTYWKQQRWMTVVKNCIPPQTACNSRDIVGCFVVGLNDHHGVDGDITLLLSLEQSAGAAPIKLKLERCSIDEIELNR